MLTIKNISTFLFFFLIGLNINAQNIEVGEVKKLLQDFKADYIYLVNELSDPNREGNDKLIDKYIKKMIENHFVANNSEIYNFDRFGAGIQIDLVSEIKDFLDDSASELENVDSFTFSDIRKHEFYRDSLFLFTCQFNVKAQLFNRENKTFQERGSFVIWLDKSSKIIAIYHKNYIDKNRDKFYEKIPEESHIDIDSDNDGILDKEDECPKEAGLRRFNGCPDDDGDGIPDKDDECPDVYGLKAHNGCPDADNDGIRDKDDECPKVAGLSRFDGCPDTDGDGVPDKEDKCPEIAGKEGNGCEYPDKFYFPKAFKMNISVGSGVMAHPTARRDYDFIGAERFTSPFDTGGEQFPMEGIISFEYLFKKNGKTKHGLKLGLGYNTYSFRYIDPAEVPSTSANLITNQLINPQFIYGSLSYRIGFFPMYNIFNREITSRNLLVFNIGANMRYELTKTGNIEFTTETPIYGFFHVRYYILYFNIEYPLYELTGQNSFINPTIINANEDFVPYIFSFGIEFPLW